ncbi:MAG TPA: aminotransferase class V-fold PLP-dependent enzyme [Oligoflexus sp.]|uniref:aminotransferase class V-fold PLP-dependent enzyme n=1 Tax=Oligoflexus sp. TaxID=1971216 RepID=UPI002D7F68A4|nr:aminotransferase class V-fold PLP-dependent enzyme [Oligoflexus sp.]HET9241268.1 aminotransferase class V-fold PLP-dependent enzyme [Oligoflexus sp.]
MLQGPTLFQAENLGAFPNLSKLARQHWRPVSAQNRPPRAAPEISVEDKLRFLREQKIGRLTLLPSPRLWQGVVGEQSGPSLRAMLHLDYTASAQGLAFIERYMNECLTTYANTHTETSTTGRYSTCRLHEAIEIIRRHVGAGEDSFVVPAGYGATGAIEKIQKILGLYLSPKGQKLIREQLGVDLKQSLAEKIVVFVGPYEHHSNDVSWQDDALCTFVRIKALRDGPCSNDVDLEDLDRQLAKYPNHLKIGSFSAASNVTGIKSHLKDISDVLHRHQALFCVDYAACAPYADINMERDGIDAIFLSVHKNLGGANIGFLVGRRHLYDMTSNPSFGGGGTVAAVTPWEYHFHPSIEERESAGTPAIRQTWQAALSFQIKDWVGKEAIHRLENQLSEKMLQFFAQHPKLEILGNCDPQKRYPIFSFLVRHGQRKLHHTFVAVLLNDFFGVQARSGCACAGPFGHELLGIERDLSGKYVELILNILNGFKPGWTRIGTHYTMNKAELDYTRKALSAIGWFGALFLDQYRFDPYTGDWQHKFPSAAQPRLHLDDALTLQDSEHLLPQLADEESLEACWADQLEEFYLLASAQLGRLILEESAGRAAQVSLDQLATACYPLIKKQVEEFTTSEDSFLQELVQTLCPLLVPAGKTAEDCRRDIEQLLRGLLFAPEKQMHRFEGFDGIDTNLPFFFVAKDHLTRPIIWEKVRLSSCSRPLQSLPI